MDLEGNHVDKQESHVEIQSLSKSEEPSLLRDNKSECAQDTGEEISNAVMSEDDLTNTPVHGQPLLEHVTDGANSSLVNESEPKLTEVIEVVSVPDKSNEKGTDDLQNSGDKTEVENTDVKLLQTVNHSEGAQANNNKGDENTITTDTEQVRESENKLESVKPGSTKQTVKAPSTTHTHWTGSNVLVVRGLAPTQSGVSELKQLNGQIINVLSLITTLAVPLYNVRCEISGFHTSIVEGSSCLVFCVVSDA
jgi:hypothetical protein